MGNKKSSCKKGTSSSFKAEIVQATEKQTASLIFLHGLGDTGHGWALNLKKHVPKYCTLICPHASEIPVTLQQGMKMPAWFDIFDLRPEGKQDEEGVKKAARFLQSIIEREVASGVAPERILIGGFSQGGAVALYTALTTNHPDLGGVLALSSWLPLHTKFKAHPDSITVSKSVHILQCHGARDPLVPLEMGAMTSQFLQDFGLVNSRFLTYQNMAHSSDEAEMQDVEKYILEVIPPV